MKLRFPKQKKKNHPTSFRDSSFLIRVFLSQRPIPWPPQHAGISSWIILYSVILFSVIYIFFRYCLPFSHVLFFIYWCVCALMFRSHIRSAILPFFYSFSPILVSAWADEHMAVTDTAVFSPVWNIFRCICLPLVLFPTSADVPLRHRHNR